MWFTLSNLASLSFIYIYIYKLHKEGHTEKWLMRGVGWVLSPWDLYSIQYTVYPGCNTFSPLLINPLTGNTLYTENTALCLGKMLLCLVIQHRVHAVPKNNKKFHINQSVSRYTVGANSTAYIRLFSLQIPFYLLQ